jgi:hypothetical protein
VQALNHVV